jgi:diguanylate cyclase (GGDEF)-like protein
MGRVLKGHRSCLRELSAISATGQAGASQSELDRLGSLAKQNGEAGEALGAQMVSLEKLCSAYGQLYENEQSNVDAYCRWTRKLDFAIHAFEENPNDECSRVALTLARKMLRENDKLRNRLSSCESQIVSLLSDRTRLEREARTDTLTQIANRRAWDEDLSRRNPEVPAGFVMVDVDHFKQVNDTHGHSAGDGVLMLIATLMRDTPELRPYRLSGDEFAMVMPGGAWPRMEPVLERLRGRIERAALNDQGQRVQVTVSMGAAESRPGVSIQLALQRADEALYVAKAAGGNRLRVHDGSTVRDRSEPLPA